MANEQGLEMAQEEDLSRRAFIKVVGGCVGAAYLGAIGYPVYRYLATPAVRAASAAAVTEVALDALGLEAGAALMFRFGTKPGILIHHKDGSWVAFSAVCSHLGCTVQFEPQNDRIFCACHEGVYDPRTGDAIAGPPPKGLTVYRVEVTDAEVVVSRT